jgi:hypothetical protein
MEWSISDDDILYAIASACRHLAYLEIGYAYAMTGLFLAQLLLDCPATSRIKLNKFTYQSTRESGTYCKRALQNLLETLFSPLRCFLNDGGLIGISGGTSMLAVISPCHHIRSKKLELRDAGQFPADAMVAANTKLPGARAEVRCRS